MRYELICIHKHFEQKFLKGLICKICLEVFCNISNIINNNQNCYTYRLLQWLFFISFTHVDLHITYNVVEVLASYLLVIVNPMFTFLSHKVFFIFKLLFKQKQNTNIVFITMSFILP